MLFRPFSFLIVWVMNWFSVFVRKSVFADFVEVVEVVEVVRKVTHVDEKVVAPMNLIKSSTLHAPKTMSESAWSLRTNFPKYTLPMLV